MTTNLDFARKGIRRAWRWLQGAKRALEDKRWDDAVYCSQMAVEQSSKAILILLGIDYPKEHDISDVFIQLSSRQYLPLWFRENVKEMCSTISELSGLRGLAAYGYEKGMDEEYFADYAPEAYVRALNHYKACLRLLNELYEEN